MDSINITITTGLKSQTALIESNEYVGLEDVAAEVHVAVGSLIKRLIADTDESRRSFILPFNPHTEKFELDADSRAEVPQAAVVAILSRYDYSELSEEDLINLANFYVYALDNGLSIV